MTGMRHDTQGPVARVLQITSRRIVPPHLGQDATFDERFAWLMEEIADQLGAALAQPVDGRPLNLMCSTVLSKMVSGLRGNAQLMFDHVESRTGLRPAGLLQAYECAGWGYAIRFAAQHSHRRWVVLSIVDDDLHDMLSVGYSNAIGRIGFAVTTVSLELNGQIPHCNGAELNRAFTDLLHAVRAHQARTGPIPIFMPFWPEGLAATVRRMLGGAVTANRHDHYGHIFGADPWVGLAEWLQAQRPAAEQQVTLAACGHDGYYTMCSVLAGPQTRVDLRADAVSRPDMSTMQ
jgi:hypothetical protein